MGTSLTAPPGTRRAFRCLATDAETSARAGLLQTAHGAVETPCFMPVGTLGAVKGLTPRQLGSTGARMILANALHLSFRPGVATIAAAGGLHRFSGFDGAILTDSGGFQVMSLAPWREVSEAGVRFHSPLDGRALELSPEGAVELQLELGADVLMPLDECLAFAEAGDRERAAEAAARTQRWLERAAAHWRSLSAERPAAGALFGIVQGGFDRALRREAAARAAALDLPGYAVGGVSVGETPEEQREVLAWTLPELPADRPRYVMGLGAPADLLDALALGADLFDCVLPTRNARRGYAFTRAGPVRLRNARHATDPAPLDPDCPCECCRTTSRALLRHLLLAGETCAGTLLTLHNLHFYLGLMREARAAILDGAFAGFRRRTLAGLARADLTTRAPARPPGAPAELNSGFSPGAPGVPPGVPVVDLQTPNREGDA